NALPDAPGLGEEVRGAAAGSALQEVLVRGILLGGNVAEHRLAVAASDAPEQGPGRLGTLFDPEIVIGPHERLPQSREGEQDLEMRHVRREGDKRGPGAGSVEPSQVVAAR